MVIWELNAVAVEKKLGVRVSNHTKMIGSRLTKAGHTSSKWSVLDRFEANTRTLPDMLKMLQYSSYGARHRYPVPYSSIVVDCADMHW